MIRKSATLIAIAFITSLIAIFAFIPQALADNGQYVFDEATMITNMQRDELNAKAAEIDNNYGVIVNFAFLNTQEDLSGDLGQTRLREFLERNSPQSMLDKPSCTLIVSPLSRTYHYDMWKGESLTPDSNAFMSSICEPAAEIYKNGGSWGDVPAKYYEAANARIAEARNEQSTASDLPTQGIAQQENPGNPDANTNAPYSNNAVSNENLDYYMDLLNQMEQANNNSAGGMGGIFIMDNAEILDDDAEEKLDQRLRELFSKYNYNVIIYYAGKNDGYDTQEELKEAGYYIDSIYNPGGGANGKDRAYIIISLNPSTMQCYFVGDNLDKLGVTNDDAGMVYKQTAESFGKDWEENTTAFIDMSYTIAEHPETIHDLAVNGSSGKAFGFITWPMLIGIGVIALIVIIVLIAVTSVKKKKAAPAYPYAQQPYPGQPYQPNAGYPQPQGNTPYNQQGYPPQQFGQPYSQQTPQGGYQQQQTRQMPRQYPPQGQYPQNRNGNNPY